MTTEVANVWHTCRVCKNTEFKTTVVIEKGEWIDDETYINSQDWRVTGVTMPLTCTACGTENEWPDHEETP